MAALLASIPLNPIITGSALYILTKAPLEVQQPVLQGLGSYVSIRTLARCILGLKWLFALGLIRHVHTYLSNLAQNNFRFGSEIHRYDWPKEIAVVTGAANGFGRLISEGLAANGLNVMALDLVDSLPVDMQSNKKIRYYKCDVTSDDAVNSTADAIRSAHGNPSILINNAGLGGECGILQMSPEKIRGIFEVNTLSHYYTVNAFVPNMIAQRKGHIVTMASMASFMTAPVSTHNEQLAIGTL